MGNMHLAASLVKQAIPQFNPIIAEGIAVAHFRELENYLLQIFREVSEGFPAGFRFIGMRRCTPEEEVKLLLEKKAASRDAKRTIEIAKSSVYLVRLEFEFEGKPIFHDLYLPYIEAGSRMWLRGTYMNIVPIVTAPVFSVERMHQQIFLKLLVTKLTFRRISHVVLCDGRDMVMGVVWSKIHGVNPKDMPHYETKKDETVKMKHAIVIYPFCHYGLTESFKRYCHIDVFVGKEGVIDFKDANPADYAIFSSKKKRPSSVKGVNYTGHDVCLAVPRDALSSTMVVGFVAGFFYIADNYYLYMDDIEELEIPDFWRVILGKACFMTKDNVAKLLMEINKHMDSIARMLDTMVLQDLHRLGIHVNNMVDLLAYVVENFANILYGEDSGSLYDKKLLVLRNVCEELIKGINGILFKTLNAKHLKEKVILQEIGKNLIFDRILSIVNSSCTTTILAPSDNMMFNHTCRFLMQNDISVKRPETGINVNNPDKHLHSSCVEIGSCWVIKDSEPTGRQYLNPYQITGQSGIIKRNPKFKQTMELINARVSR